MSRHSIESDCGILYACHQPTVQEILGFKSGKGADSQSCTASAGGWRLQGLRIHPPPHGKQERVHILLLFFPMFLYNAWALVRHMLQYSCPGMHVTLKRVVRLFLAFVKELGLARPPT